MDHVYNFTIPTTYVLLTLLTSPTDGPPADIVATVLSSTSIRVTWDPLSTLSSVTNYIISYDGVANFVHDGSETVDQSSTSATINGLEEFVSYDIIVQAAYGERSGPLSVAVRVRTFSDGKCMNLCYMCLSNNDKGSGVFI